MINECGDSYTVCLLFWVAQVETSHVFLNGPNPASFCLFLSFILDKYSTDLTITYISIDGVLGT